MKSDPQSETCDERQELYLATPCRCFLIWKKGTLPFQNKLQFALAENRMNLRKKAFALEKYAELPT